MIDKNCGFITSTRINCWLRNEDVKNMIYLLLLSFPGMIICNNIALHWHEPGTILLSNKDHILVNNYPMKNTEVCDPI